MRISRGLLRASTVLGALLVSVTLAEAQSQVPAEIGRDDRVRETYRAMSRDFESRIRQEGPRRELAESIERLRRALMKVSLGAEVREAEISQAAALLERAFGQLANEPMGPALEAKGSAIVEKIRAVRAAENEERRVLAVDALRALVPEDPEQADPGVFRTSLDPGETAPRPHVLPASSQ